MGTCEESNRTVTPTFGPQNGNCVSSGHLQTTPIVTHQKLQELGWVALIQALYSPDLKLSDYNMSASMGNDLAAK